MKQKIGNFTDQLVHTLEGHTLHVESLSYSPDGTQLTSGSFAKTIHIWNIRK